MQGNYKRTVELPIHVINMGMSLDQNRGAIGSFNNVKFILVPASNVCAWAAWFSVSNVLITIIVPLIVAQLRYRTDSRATQALYSRPLQYQKNLS